MKNYEWRGEINNLSGWAKHFKYSVGGLSCLIKRYSGTVQELFDEIEEAGGKAPRGGRPKKMKEFYYTGEPFVSSTGKKIRPGHRHTMQEWADLTGRNYQTFMGKYSREKKETTKQEALNRAINYDSNFGRYLPNDQTYTYTGDTFATKAGEEIVPGTIMALKTWLTTVGMARGTFVSRYNRMQGGMSTEIAFNEAISKPVRQRGSASTDVLRPVPILKDKKAEESRVKQSEFVGLRRKAGVKMAEILACRVRYPDQPCMPCRFKISCFGEARL